VVDPSADVAVPVGTAGVAVVLDVVVGVVVVGSGVRGSAPMNSVTLSLDTLPGAMPLTRTLFWPHSAAHDLV